MAFAIPSGTSSTYQVVGVRAVITTPAVGKTFKVQLYDGTTVQQDVTMDSDAMRIAATGTQLIEVYFDEVTLTTLNCGTTYYVALAPQETSSNLALVTWSATAAQDARAAGGDGNFYLVTRNGAAWTTDTNTRPAMELILADVSAGSGGRIVGGGF